LAIATVFSLAAQQPAGKKYQAKPPATQHFGAEAFGASRNTTIRWLGNAGFLINSRGTDLLPENSASDNLESHRM